MTTNLSLSLRSEAAAIPFGYKPKGEEFKKGGTRWKRRE
jgi:hypothetical protein